MKLSDYKSSVEYPLKQLTLCFLVREGEVLLAMKKRGFGAGKWNGVGGKPNPDEEIEATAIRETQEEINVVPKSLIRRAVLDFYMPHNPKYDQQVIVYLCRDWEGEPVETEEMKPQWHKLDGIPYDSMWPDDMHWLPHVLEGSQIGAEFLFAEDDSILDFHIIEFDGLE